MDAPRTHIAVVPNAGGGHLTHITEFARCLLLHNPSLFFTFILVPDSAAEAESPAVLSSLLPSTAFEVVHLPLPPPFPIGVFYSRFLNIINNSLDALRQTLRDLTHKNHRVSALIVDIFATEVISVGSEQGVKSYLFFPASAMALSMSLHFPDETPSWSMDEPLQFPGCPVIRVKDLPEQAQNPSTPYYKWFVGHCKRFSSAHAIVLNSFRALEEEPIKTLTSVHAVGPLVRKGDDVVHDLSGCMRWLDEQPPESVLFVNFGSGRILSSEQVTELAWGLELSQQRFIWVVRSPNEERDPREFLPKGFVEMTKGRGLVVLSQAPQVEILGHMSTGGFMTHCGWNSVLEGVVNGVGFITWPLYADQRMNAIELVETVKIAIKIEKDKGDGVFRRDEIAKAVKELMEGDEGKKIKEKMRTLKDEAKTTMGEDGALNVTLSKLAYMLGN